MSSAPGPETVNILLVDDRPGNLDALEAILQRPDYRLVRAASGREALTRILQEDFAVILLDVAMPGMDGFETASLIKQRERSATIPIIFVTASIYDVENVFRGYSVGAVDYLRKPLEPHVVQAKVAVFVELHRQKQEIRRQSELLRRVEQRERELMRQRADEVIHRSEARYDAMFEHAPVGIAQADLEGRFVRANSQMERLLGVEPDTLLGKTLGRFTHPDDAATLAAEMESLAANGRSALCLSHRVLRGDGRVMWVQTTLSLVRDRSGDPQQLVLVLEDVTERRWSEQTSRFLVDAGRVLLGSLDYEKTLRSVARLAVEGFCEWCVVDLLDDEGSLATLAADHVDPAVAPAVPRLRDHWQESSDALDRVLRTSDPYLWTMPDVSALDPTEGDGSVTTTRAAIVVPLAARGRMFGAMTFASADRGRIYGEGDVRTAMELGHRAALAIENARLYRDAEQAIRARDEFLSVAAHELRTPLTPLRLIVQTYQKLLERGQHQEVLERLPTTFARALRQIDRLSWLVDTLLDVSALREGRLRILRTHADLAEIARDTADRFEEEGRASGSRITLDVESAPGVWDRHRLEQVLSNLVSNAIKYGDGKEISIRVRGGNPACLIVQDHGIGIPEDKQSRIFEPFERAVSPLSFGGLGLGLYIVRQIVEAHDGQITVSSRPGDGTRFVVELPTGLPADRQPEAPSAPRG